MEGKYFPKIWISCIFNTTIWRSPVQFKTVLEVTSVRALAQSQSYWSAQCTGFDCRFWLWKQICQATEQDIGRESGAWLYWHKTEVFVPILLPLVQKSMTETFAATLCPGMVKDRAADNSLVYNKGYGIQGRTQCTSLPRPTEMQTGHGTGFSALFLSEADVTAV